MLALYHGEPTAQTLKLLICLFEQNRPFASRYVDTGALEQWSSSHRELAPQGTLPVLVDDGEVMNEPSLALQYLAETGASLALRPSDALGWYQTQAWIETLDAALLKSVAMLGWNLTWPADERADYFTRLAQVEGRERAAGWTAVWSDAEADEDQLAIARERIGDTAQKVERALRDSTWLVGESYSIADISAYALLHSLPRLTADIVNAARTPRLADWLTRIGGRAAVVKALAMRRLAGDKAFHAMIE